MVLTSSSSSSTSSSSSAQPKSSSALARKIKIRQQIADSGRSKSREAAASSRMMASRGSELSARLQQQQPKVRKIAVESSGGSSNGGGGVGSGSGSGSGASTKQQPQQQQQRPRNSSVLLQHESSSASAAARSAPRRAASPVLSQSGRRQLLVHSRSPSPEPAQQQLRPIGKSASLPDTSQAIAAAASSERKQKSQSILKRSSSSSLLASLEARGLRSFLQLRRHRRKTEADCSQPSRSPSPQRKCVSFSADTIERHEERQRPSGPLKKQPLHDTKLYRKGVLQDQRGSSRGLSASYLPNNNLPLSWEESLGGPRALLGAAHDADDELVQRIVNLANKVGLGNIQLNAQDNSGRTAISYLAGNGSALVLEACLALPGADANLPDNEGNTPLHFAAQAGQTECLNILLQRCANIEVDARNNLGFTPLMKAGLQGRTKCAKILLFAGANPTLRDHGRGLRAEQWARFCGRYITAEVIERFARHRLLEKTTSCRWGSEPELAAQVLQGKLMPVPSIPVQPPPASGLKSKIRRVFRTTSNSDKTSFSLVSQLTSAALCASSPVLPKPGDVSPVVKSLLRPLSVPQLRITLVTPQDVVEKATSDNKCTSHGTSFSEKIESTMVKPPRTKKKSK